MPSAFAHENRDERKTSDISARTCFRMLEAEQSFENFKALQDKKLPMNSPAPTLQTVLSYLQYYSGFFPEDNHLFHAYLGVRKFLISEELFKAEMKWLADSSKEIVNTALSELSWLKILGELLGVQTEKKKFINALQSQFEKHSPKNEKVKNNVLAIDSISPVLPYMLHTESFLFSRFMDENSIQKITIFTGNSFLKLPHETEDYLDSDEMLGYPIHVFRLDDHRFIVLCGMGESRRPERVLLSRASMESEEEIPVLSANRRLLAGVHRIVDEANLKLTLRYFLISSLFHNVVQKNKSKIMAQSESDLLWDLLQNRLSLTEKVYHELGIPIPRSQ